MLQGNQDQKSNVIQLADTSTSDSMVTFSPPAAVELPWPLTSVYGKDRHVEFQWKDECSITLSNDLCSFKSCEHNPVLLLKLVKQQNKAIFILLCHQDINPQAARQILELLEWRWKGGWICGHSGSAQCDFSGIQGHFSDSHLLARQWHLAQSWITK